MKTPLFLSPGAALLTATLAYAGAADENAMAQTVALHNQWRQEAGSSGSLTWDQGLADGAQTWAEHCASTGVMEHEDMSAWGGGEWMSWAENISGGSTPEEAATRWYEEKAFYEEVRGSGKNCRPDSIPMSDYMKCGHYANIVGSSTHIGCGMSGQYLVCRYASR